MDGSSRNTTLIVGAVAAAAGIAIASYLYLWRLKTTSRGTPPLQGVKDVLNDCYERMSELQESIAHIPNGVLQPSPPQN